VLRRRSLSVVDMGLVEDVHVESSNVTSARADDRLVPVRRLSSATIPERLQRFAASNVSERLWDGLDH
jgi:hypothetical protein